MELKPAYRQAEVGVIPHSWRVERLGALLKYERPDPYIVKSTNYDNGSPTPVLTANKSFVVGYTSETFGICEDLPAIIFDDFTTDNKYVDFPFKVKSSAMKILRCKNDTTSLAFIHGKMQLAQFPVGGHKRHYISEYQELLFAVPEEAEQRAIAGALRDVDALLGALTKVIAKKRDLKQAAMQQLLTGETRLPGFSGEWQAKRLGDVGRCLRGVSYKGDSDLMAHDSHRSKRLLRANNVQNATVVTSDIQFVNLLRVSAQQVMRQNDILVCMANGSKDLVGKSGLFQISDGYEYTFGAFMGVFRTSAEQANAVFVFFLFQTGQYRNYINNLLAGSSINNLRPSSIESLQFSVPAVPEQTAIASVLTDMDTELAALERRLAKTRALKQGMMQVLLTGRIRLV